MPKAGAAANAAAPAAPPTTDLAEQLNKLAVRQQVDQGRRHRGKASLLYTFQEAADIDGETIYRVGLEGEPSCPACSCLASPAACCRRRRRLPSPPLATLPPTTGHPGIPPLLS